MLTIVIPEPGIVRTSFRGYVLLSRSKGFEPGIVFADRAIRNSSRKQTSIGAFGDLNIFTVFTIRTSVYVSKLSDTLGVVETPFTSLGADDDFFYSRRTEQGRAVPGGKLRLSLATGTAIAFELNQGRFLGRRTK